MTACYVSISVSDSGVIFVNLIYGMLRNENVLKKGYSENWKIGNLYRFLFMRSVVEHCL